MQGHIRKRVHTTTSGKTTVTWYVIIDLPRDTNGKRHQKWHGGYRTRRDAEITKGIYRRVPVLVDENKEDGNPWGITFQRMFDMSNDSHLFRTRDQLAPIIHVV